VKVRERKCGEAERWRDGAPSATRELELKALVVYGGRFGPTLKRMAYKQLPRLRFETVRPPDDWTTRRR
jgi:hypothetical protein